MKLSIKIINKCSAIFFTLIILFSSFIPLLSPVNVVKSVEANACSASSGSGNYGRVGGIALDQAATFLAEMDELTGAYYDEEVDRIVFVGKKNTVLPEFDKDDLAVAIKAVLFNKELPAVSIENGADPNKQYVVYRAGIENTRFGQILFDADYEMKKYVLGYDENDNPISSSVSGYKSIIHRYIDKLTGSGTNNYGRQWISPDEVILKKDDATDSFVFETVTMKVDYESLSLENDPLYDEAGEEFATHHTDHFDDFADEIPSYKDTKQLAKIVSVIKWLTDNGIDSDFSWAHDYEPEYIDTPEEISKLSTTDTYSGLTYTVSGGVEYYTSNDYEEDTGEASDLKTASEAVNAPKEEIHWTFTEDSQEYEAVAVAADAFRSLGSYNTSVTDMSFPLSGDLNLEFVRSYSSYSGGQFGIGRGWSFIPAKLVDGKPLANGILLSFCDAGDTFLKRKQLVFETNGIKEAYTYDDENMTACNYLPDEEYFHSTIAPDNPSSVLTTYQIKTKDQTKYTFEDLVNVEYVTNYSLRLKSIEDDSGSKINYNYESTQSAKLVSISDDYGHIISINYSTENTDLISSISDWDSRTVNYNYDTQGNLISVTDPEGNVTEYEYDQNNKLISIEDREDNVVLENEYTPEAKIAIQTNASGLTTIYSYDEDNRVITATDSASPSRQSSIKYDEKARVLEDIDPYSNKFIYTYDTESAPLTIKDKNNNTTVNTYDADGNLTSVTYPNNKTVTYEYDSNNRVTEISDGRYGGSSKVSSFTYDGFGNLTIATESGKTTFYSYNEDGELLTKTNPLNKTYTWTRNSFGNILTEEDPLENISTYNYDVLGRLVRSVDKEDKENYFIYDNNNNVIVSSNSAGLITSYQYDKENRLEKTILPDDNEFDYSYNNSGSIDSVIDPAEEVTNYSYNSYQDLTSRENALDKTTIYQYDKLSRKTSRVTPLGKVLDWEYDNNGNISKRIDEKNNETDYQYDVMNRLTLITYPDSTTVSYTYDDRGNVLTLVDPIGTTTYTYDIYDRLTSVTDPNSEEVEYEYDSNDNLVKITYPGDKEVDYLYDDVGRLVSVTDWNEDETAYEYFDNGLIQSKELPNGIITEYEYDEAKYLSKITHKRANNSIIGEFTYERDEVGNILSSTENSGYFLPSASSVQTEPTQYDIYSDSLSGDWESWSWSSSINFSNTTNPYLGTNSISWTANAGYAGLYLHTDTGIQTDDYTDLTFAVRATTGGEAVSVSLYDENDDEIGTPLQLDAYGGYPISGDYKVYTIPLDDLGGENTLIKGIVIQEDEGTSQPVVYIDSVALKGGSEVPPVEPENEYVYEDSLSGDWESWSWSSSINFSNTTNPNNGTNSIAWTANTGYAGLYLHSDSGFQTDGHSDLTFAVRATTGGEAVSVLLYDDQDTAIGSSTSLSSYGGYPVSGSYKTYTIPLEDLGGENTTINGILIQEEEGTSQPVVYVDDVAFVAESAGEIATGSAQFTQDMLYAYNDSLESGWVDWSWDSVNNFADDSNIYTGDNNISWQSNADGGLFFHNSGGVSTVNYDAVVFALKATQAGQEVDVQLYDTNDTEIGSPLSLANYGGDPVASGYKVYTIPLEDLGGNDITINGIAILDSTGVNQPQMYVDMVGLVKQTVSYSYDELGQILTATYPDGAIYEYTYDEVGNRLTSEINSDETTYTYDYDNRLLTRDLDEFEYDDNGNQIDRDVASKSASLLYNYENKLATHSAVTDAINIEYIYDGNGNRIGEKVNTIPTTQYVNDVSSSLTHVLIEKDLQASTDNYYVYGDGLIGQGGVTGSTRTYFLEDGLGNIRFVADSNASEITPYVYDPYGNLIEGDDTAQMLFKKEHQDSTGFYYMRARYYDPTTGSFISRDPVDGRTIEPSTQNGYNYAINNPIGNSDPSGLDYVNLGFSAGIPPLGIGAGALIADSGNVHLYHAAGIAYPGGVGGSVTHSSDDPQVGSDYSIQGGIPILGIPLVIQANIDPRTGAINIERGIGSPGGSYMIQRTYGPICKF